MSVNYDRRALLEGAAATLLLSFMRSAHGSASTSTASGVRLLTITYPAGPNIHFDPVYYRDHHAKLFMEIYGGAIERFELRTLQPSQGSSFSALINVWIADFAQFRERSTPAAYQRMGDDRKNFSNQHSEIQVDEVVHEVGASRDTVPVGSDCLTLLYPAAAHVAGWSDPSRCREFANAVQHLLGKRALRRIELRKGIEQLDDGSPAYQGGINMYAADAVAFSRGWQQNRPAILRLSSELWSTTPVEVSTTVFGVDHV